MAKKVTITAFWGNGCAESSLKLPIRTWERIERGELFSKSTWGYYEGTRYSVFWEFKDKMFSVTCDDGLEAIIESELLDLNIDYNP